MEITNVRKGEKATMPLHYLGKGGGYSGAEVPENGLRLKLDDSEWMAGGVYIRESELEAAGYARAKVLKRKVKELAKALLKDELQWLAEKLGLSINGTKLQLAERILNDS